MSPARPSAEPPVPPGSEEYRRYGATVLRSLIDPLVTVLLCNYAQLQAHNGRTVVDSGQVSGSMVMYGDPVLDTLLGQLTSPMAQVVGRPLLPTYSFLRIYRRGQTLVVHKDRPSCEHSVTVHLGASSTDAWPVEYTDLLGTDHHVELSPGEAVAYRGSELAHWRDPCPVDWYIQLFLHYVDATGPHSRLRYDGRRYLGLPRNPAAG